MIAVVFEGCKRLHRNYLCYMMIFPLFHVLYLKSLILDQEFRLPQVLKTN